MQVREGDDSGVWRNRSGAGDDCLIDCSGSGADGGDMVKVRGDGKLPTVSKIG